MSENPEDFLYKNFELLFSKEQPSNESLSSRLENRFIIKDSGKLTPKPIQFSIAKAFGKGLVTGILPPEENSVVTPNQDTTTKQHDYFKIEFDKLREMIDKIIKAEQTMSGGNIPSLKYIKKYINDKIKDIIPRD